MPSSAADDNKPERLVRIFDQADRKTAEAYFWDWLRRDVPAWADVKYEWVACSIYGDQIILTNNSPIHPGSAVYMLGPDVAGPKSDNPDWPDNLLYLGPSIEVWLARIDQHGDEYSVVPGSIDELVNDPAEYRKLYRGLNPGLQW